MLRGIRNNFLQRPHFGESSFEAGGCRVREECLWKVVLSPSPWPARDSDDPRGVQLCLNGHADAGMPAVAVHRDVLPGVRVRVPLVQPKAVVASEPAQAK